MGMHAGACHLPPQRVPLAHLLTAVGQQLNLLPVGLCYVLRLAWQEKKQYWKHLTALMAGTWGGPLPSPIATLLSTLLWHHLRARMPSSAEENW